MSVLAVLPFSQVGYSDVEIWGKPDIVKNDCVWEIKTTSCIEGTKKYRSLLKRAEFQAVVYMLGLGLLSARVIVISTSVRKYEIDAEEIECVRERFLESAFVSGSEKLWVSKMCEN